MREMSELDLFGGELAPAENKGPKLCELVRIARMIAL